MTPLVPSGWGLKRPEREPTHSSPSFVENKDVCSYAYTVGCDSSVGIASRYGLEDMEIETRWWDEIFRTRQDWSWGPFCLL